MFCSNCGSKVDDNARFCMNCGARVQVQAGNINIPNETKLVPAKCAACGASVKVNPDSEIAQCPYCGSNYIVEKAINNFNVANGNIQIESSTVNIIMNGDNRPKQKDSLFAEAGQLVIEKKKGSTALLQRTFKIGFERANDIMLQLEDAGVVGPLNGPQRKVIMSQSEFDAYLKEKNYI